MTESSARLLRRALRANATFSTLSGLTFAFASELIADFAGNVPAVEIATIGVSLVGFAGFLAWLSLRPAIPSGLVKLVIAADLVWVVGSMLVVFTDLFTKEGAIAALIVSNFVLTFAVLQWFGLQRAQSVREST